LAAEFECEFEFESAPESEVDCAKPGNAEKVTAARLKRLHNAAIVARFMINPLL
jgi:hypothetical protein